MNSGQFREIYLRRFIIQKWLKKKKCSQTREKKNVDSKINKSQSLKVFILLKKENKERGIKRKRND